MCPASVSNASAPSAFRRALTLVEMLISLVCVILLMLAYTQLFSTVGTRISDARSMIDLTNRMRSTANRLRTDLAGHTCDLIPWQNPASGDGYFEYIEGPLHDKPGQNGLGYNSNLQVDESNFLGDTDDVLMFTVRSKDGAFSGLYTDASGTTHTVQSQVAEVVWFLRPTLLVDPASASTTAATVQASPPTFTLYRHTYLVLPTYQGNSTPLSGAAPSSPSGLLLPLPGFYQTNDISAHIQLNDAGTPIAVPNTLGDLAKRECRFGHAFIKNTSLANGFPHRVDPTYLLPFGGILDSTKIPPYQVVTSNSRYGEDVVLTNVVSFDVQAWDPTAPVYSTSTMPSVAVSPSDPGFKYQQGDPSSSNTNIKNRSLADVTDLPASLGSFVDLNWLNPVKGTPSNANINSLWNGTALYAPWNSSVAISPFFCQGEVKSQLTAASPSTGPTSPPFFYDPLQKRSGTWLFDDNHTNNLPDYGLYGYTPATYDTWSTHYEHDGLDQDKTLGDTQGPDQASSGFQDNANNTETSPPYPVPLRGIKITIRCYEPDSRQMHEVSVVESFVPE